MPETFELAGTGVDPEGLNLDQSRSFVRHVAARGDGAFSVTGARDFDGSEGVIVAARPAMPQRRLYEFEDEEPLLVLFWKDGTSLPSLLSLRKDFPRAPHMNLVRKGGMPAICLFGEDPDEVRQRLTPQLLADRILWWFESNASGDLHRDDQALEPFLTGAAGTMYFPADAFEGDGRRVLSVFAANAGTDHEVVVADDADALPAELRDHPASLYSLSLPVQAKGLMYEQPESLRDLAETCAESGFDLLGSLAQRITDTHFEAPDSWATFLLLRIPKARPGSVEAETQEYRAFRLRIRRKGEVVDATPQQIGQALGILGFHGGLAGPLIGARPTMDGASQVEVSMLLPYPLTDRQEAARLSGLDSAVTKRIVAIGVGALGSQVFEALARQSYGTWTLVDHDSIAPHNLARHAILGRRYGFGKAAELAARANEQFKGDPVATPLRANVNSPEERSDELREAFGSADLILDMSASTAAARQAVHGIASAAARMGLFLSPSGGALVALWEGRSRSVPMDGVEAQYLRAVIHDERLASLLAKPDGPLRYGPGCRDRSSRIPSEMVSLHASIGARMVKELSEREEPALLVWRCDPDSMEVRRTDVEVVSHSSVRLDEWSVEYDAGFIGRIAGMRSDKLPNETCGVLLGQVDALRKRLYLVDALAAPSDSEESPDGCKRGVDGLATEVAAIRRKTGGDVDYVGEWHSHPNGAACSPSARDMAQMDWIRGRMHPAGLPAVMLIACEGGGHLILFHQPGFSYQELSI